MGRTKSLASLNDCTDATYRVINTPLYSAGESSSYKKLLVRVTDFPEIRKTLKKRAGP